MVSILLVDDHTIFRDGLKHLLHEENDLRVAAETADAGEALLCLRSTPIDVVLLDIGLPSMDGLEVARRLRELPGEPRTVLVALTGYGQEEDRARSREAGFDHHLTKPVDLDTLVKVLGEVQTVEVA